MTSADSGMFDWPTARPLRIEGAWTREAGEDTTVFHPRTGRLVTLNPSAYAIWELCDGYTSGDEMVDAVVELTGSERPLVEAQVLEVLEHLWDAELIKPGP